MNADRVDLAGRQRPRAATSHDQLVAAYLDAAAGLVDGGADF